MKKTVKSFIRQVRSLIGDETISIPDEFLINALNWAFNSLPSVPKLERAFAYHGTKTLDANGHYKWELTTPFRRIADLEYLNFFTTTGGDPCPLCLCNRQPKEFYKKNGLVELKKAGVPCEYTLEQEDDRIYIVMDRPVDIPVIVDYIAYGYPKPVTSMEDEIELSAPIENLIFAAIRRMYYLEASDFAFSESISTYLDSREILEAIQMLNKTLGAEALPVLGGV